VRVFEHAFLQAYGRVRIAGAAASARLPRASKRIKLRVPHLGLQGWRTQASGPHEVAFATFGTGRAEMPDLKVIRQIIRTVLRNLPNVRCFRCLSLQVGVSEKDVREAGQLLVLNNGFVITRTGARSAPARTRRW
jgi:hypothetical protein